MKTLYTSILFSLLIQIALAQDPIVIARFNNTSVTQQDSLVIVSTLGDPFGGVTVQNGILVSSEPFPYLFISETTAVHDLPLIEGLKVFPNPTSAIATLQRSDDIENFITKLYREDGVEVFEKTWNKGESSFQFSLEDYASGIYILTITDEKETKASRFKIVKQ